MSILVELRKRFRQALAPLVEQPEPLLDLLRRSQDARFGDYQANVAMPLGKELGRPPREVAEEIIRGLDVDDFCLAPEVAGPGFINLRLRDDWLTERITAAVSDLRLGVPAAECPRKFVIDYSAPNVAKPMHVGHIRSTVIGDSLSRTLRFLGHEVIGDNHLGDWGTQFGMILYGYKHFRHDDAYKEDAVAELARLYRLVNDIMLYQNLKDEIAHLPDLIKEAEAKLHEIQSQFGENPNKKQKKELEKQTQTVSALRFRYTSAKAFLHGMESKTAVVKFDGFTASKAVPELAADYPDIRDAVLNETAKLHADDPENLALWKEFLPACRDEIDRVYGRLGITFDHTLGESFYHDRLAPVVRELLDKKIARQSDGAVCVFFDGHEAPMIVRKQDGAFLYATTDLATIRYRLETWQPDAILYVVDHRQSLHFEQLFATARRLGYTGVELTHVTFGTVLGEDGRPFKTRSGDTVGLEGLLDEAVRRAGEVVSANDDAKPTGAELSAEQRAAVAETVGIGALKYADLSQNRTSDYVFSYDKMLAMNGNTGTYMQYAYARVQAIFARGGVDVEALRSSRTPLLLDTPAERALALEILRFGEALELAVADYRPNQLTAYLFELAGLYSTFYEECPVLKAPTEAVRNSRLLLCDLTARTIRMGLELLGIEVVDKM
jgi:arginyl-tRNA synthetase